MTDDLYRRGAAYDHIGPFCPEGENRHGRLLRQFLETSDMIALNTNDPRAARVTWKGAKDRAHRVSCLTVDRALAMALLYDVNTCTDAFVPRLADPVMTTYLYAG